MVFLPQAELPPQEHGNTTTPCICVKQVECGNLAFLQGNHALLGFKNGSFSAVWHYRTTKGFLKAQKNVFYWNSGIKRSSNWLRLQPKKTLACFTPTPARATGIPCPPPHQRNTTTFPPSLASKCPPHPEGGGGGRDGSVAFLSARGNDTTRALVFPAPFLCLC